MKETRKKANIFHNHNLCAMSFNSHYLSLPHNCIQTNIISSSIRNVMKTILRFSHLMNRVSTPLLFVCIQRMRRQSTNIRAILIHMQLCASAKNTTIIQLTHRWKLVTVAGISHLTTSLCQFLHSSFCNTHTNTHSHTHKYIVIHRNTQSHTQSLVVQRSGHWTIIFLFFFFYKWHGGKHFLDKRKKIMKHSSSQNIKLTYI
jgi:hypothetical protein